MAEIPRLTREQAAIVSAYTGTLACDMDVLKEFLELIMQRKIDPAEFAQEGPGSLREEIEGMAKALFLDITYEGK